MNNNSSAFNEMWDNIILKSIDKCKSELDLQFENSATVKCCDLNEYKSDLEKIYKRKREWLKRKYLSNEEKPMLDFHKLSAIMCRSIIGLKPFSFDLSVAEKCFLDITNNSKLAQTDKVSWQINNVYINYKVAFLVAEGMVYTDLIYWALEKIKMLKDEINSQNNADLQLKIIVYEQLIAALKTDGTLYSYKTSDSHDSFIVSSIIALMKNDFLNRDFDYLQFSASMFQWQEYTKKQHLYEILTKHDTTLSLSDLV